MSILSRLTRAGHLDERALAAIWSDASLEAAEPSHPHLAACAQCRDRLAAFTAWMDALRFDARAAADEAFSAERLAAQHAHIMRRLDSAEHPARVISFPTNVRPMSSSGSHTRRWITAAAAAAFIFGVAVGQVMDFRRAIDRAATSADVRTVPPRSDRPDGSIQPALVDSDAVFMAEVDASLSRNSLSELRAFDEITPRAPFTEGRR